MFGHAVNIVSPAEERLVPVCVFTNVVAEVQRVRIQMLQLAKRKLGACFGGIGGGGVSHG
jgi:hypothetical protein